MGTPIRGEYGYLGQPLPTDVTLATRCTDAKARFDGPAGVALAYNADAEVQVLFVADYASGRVLIWREPERLFDPRCRPADEIISGLFRPEAVVYEGSTGTLFVADTEVDGIAPNGNLHPGLVYGYRFDGTTWNRVLTLGDFTFGGVFGFHFPRGLAVDTQGRLFVADDFRHRILIFPVGVADAGAPIGSISAGADGRFWHPKGIVIHGETLFVAEYGEQGDAWPHGGATPAGRELGRVVRFTGPFEDDTITYRTSGIQAGGLIRHPADVGFHPDGRLLVSVQDSPVRPGTGRGLVVFPDAVTAEFGLATSCTKLYGDDKLSPEPLGVTADRFGTIYHADFQSFRILMRAEPVRRTPVAASGHVAAETILQTLHDAPHNLTNKMALGQQLMDFRPNVARATDPDWYSDWRALDTAGVPLPKIMAGDVLFLWDRVGAFTNTHARQELIDHGKAGQWVSLCWHADNPFGGNFQSPPLTNDQWRELVTDPTSAAARDWQGQVADLKVLLKRFADDGIPVLFRPLHEQNGFWFWWGHRKNTQGPALHERQRLWLQFWQNLVAELRSLGNILFVFSAATQTFNEIVSPLTYYPGSDFVDLVGLDVYHNELHYATGAGQAQYEGLLATGKPYGLTEFGQAHANATDHKLDLHTLLDLARIRVTYAIAWTSMRKAGDGGLEGTTELFALQDAVDFATVMPDHHFMR